MQEREVYLVLGLFNSTSCTQELDQIYQEIKGNIRAKTEEIFAQKLLERSTKISNLKAQLTETSFVEDQNECKNPDIQVAPVMKDLIVKLKDTMKMSSLSNTDLSAIVNG